MNALVIVPAYNEAQAIEEVLAAIPEQFTCIVINDGSTDATGAIAEASGHTVVHHAVNRGLGAALRTGFAYASENGYDAVVTLDADGQHSPAEIQSLLERISDNSADIVIGSRVQESMPAIRQSYNKIGALVTAALFGSPLVDTQSGYRALSRAAIDAMQLTSSRMEISSEIVAEAHRLRLRIVEVPINVRYTKYSMSKGQSLVEGIRTAWRLFLRSI